MLSNSLENIRHILIFCNDPHGEVYRNNGMTHDGVWVDYVPLTGLWSVSSCTYMFGQGFCNGYTVGSAATRDEAIDKALAYCR